MKARGHVPDATSEREGGQCLRVNLRQSLAARLPGGTAWWGGEALMWKRSEVEQLTGLSRHMIQDLCNQNTAGDGLAFWVPAVSKPGFARYDEGDLMAFYLVKQLSKAGFPLAEVEAAVMDMLEDDDSFAARIDGNVRRLQSERARIDARLLAAEVLRGAAAYDPPERLYAIMAAALLDGVQRSIENAARASSLPPESVNRLNRAYQRAIPPLLEAVDWGTGSKVLTVSVPGAAVSEIRDRVQRFARALADLRKREVDPTDEEALRLVYSAAKSFWRLWGTGASAESAGEGDAMPVLVIRTAAGFLAEADNGVPVELALGKGSFTFLAQATKAYAGIA